MQWTRHYGTQLTKDFHCKELECKCGVCSTQTINEQFMAMLQEVRDEADLPITITSGYRCQRRQDDLRKQGYETAVGISSHQLGIASDIKPTDPTPENWARLKTAVEKVFAKYSIGTSSLFFHVDARPGGPRRWGYKV